MTEGVERRSKAASREAAAFWVYVIELDPDFLVGGDTAGIGKGALYVGHTSKDPLARLRQHQSAGALAARVFMRMQDPTASRLRMDLSMYAGPYSTEADARRNERRTHNRLKSDGYKVFGDLGRRISIRSRKPTEN